MRAKQFQLISLLLLAIVAIVRATGRVFPHSTKLDYTNLKDAADNLGFVWQVCRMQGITAVGSSESFVDDEMSCYHGAPSFGIGAIGYEAYLMRVDYVITQMIRLCDEGGMPDSQKLTLYVNIRNYIGNAVLDSKNSMVYSSCSEAMDQLSSIEKSKIFCGLEQFDHQVALLRKRFGLWDRVFSPGTEASFGKYKAIQSYEDFRPDEPCATEEAFVVSPNNNFIK